MHALLALLTAAALSLAATDGWAYTISVDKHLGDAAGFNLYTFRNTTVWSSDVEGQVAVGGNFSVTNPGYSIADKVAGGSLFVRGNVHWDSSGSVGMNVNGKSSGDIVYGGTQDLPQWSVSRHATTHVPPGSFPVDFKATEKLLKQESAYWGSYSTNGTASRSPWNEVTLTGNNAGLNVFNIDGSWLDAASSLTINAVQGSTLLINVSGGGKSTFSIDNFGFFLNNVSAEHILFNFYEAKSLSFAGIDFRGSILAPWADVTLGYGQINGQIIANSLTGPGQINLHAFSDSDRLPTSPVPVPGSVWLFGAGLIGLVSFRRKFL